MFDFSNLTSWSAFTSGTAPWLLGGIVALIFMAWWLMSGLRGEPTDHLPTNNRTLDAVDTVIGWAPQATRLLTHRHLRGYELLRQATPELHIFAQVPLARFVRVPTRNSYAEWLRRVGGACADLLVCDRASNVLAVVEVRAAIDGVSANARKRQQRVERVLKAAGIPLLVWDESHLPAPHEVRRTLIPPPESPVLESGSIVAAKPVVTRPVASAARNTDPAEPPRSTWFDDLNATRPVDLDSVLPPASGSTSRQVGVASPAR